MMVEKDLPSGAKLKMSVAPFAVSRGLYQAVCEELKPLRIDPQAEIDLNLRKDLFCGFLASKKIESALWPCLQRCLYNDLKIDDSTFEAESSRQDYITVCWEVAQLNVIPFMKDLFAELMGSLGMGVVNQKSKSTETTPS